MLKIFKKEKQVIEIAVFINRYTNSTKRGKAFNNEYFNLAKKIRLFEKTT